MKTLLAIISHPKDNELVARHWPYFKLTGLDILGCGTEDCKCVWPGTVTRLDTGVEGTRPTPAGSSIWGLVAQELRILRAFLNDKTFADYTDVCVVEADNLFVRPPPQHPGHGLYVVTTIPNYASPGLFKTPVYFSTPRWADRRCAGALLNCGEDMYRRGDVEHWISDRFPAHVCQLNGIPWIAQPGWSQSPFHHGSPTWEMAWVRDARAAIQLGCYCLHSVKHAWQLNALKDLLPAV